MEIIQFSVAIFHDNEGSVAVQKRDDKSRNNEKFAFWGGKTEEGESGEETMKRELIEELGYIPGDLGFAGDYLFDIKEGKYFGGKILYHTFFAQIDQKLLTTNVMEGEGIVVLDAASIVGNKNFFQGDRDLISKLLEEGKLV